MPHRRHCTCPLHPTRGNAAPQYLQPLTHGAGPASPGLGEAPNLLPRPPPTVGPGSLLLPRVPTCASSTLPRPCRASLRGRSTRSCLGFTAGSSRRWRPKVRRRGGCGQASPRRALRCAASCSALSWTLAEQLSPSWRLPSVRRRAAHFAVSSRHACTLAHARTRTHERARTHTCRACMHARHRPAHIVARKIRAEKAEWYVHTDLCNKTGIPGFMRFL